MPRTLPCPWLLPLVPALTFGCAAAPRAPQPAAPPPQEASFTGQPFALRQSGAMAPPGADGDVAGRIRGQVCGAPVGLQVEHHAGAIVLEGHVANLETEIWIGKEHNGRIISGSIGEQSFDLHLGQQRLYGRIGMVILDLRPGNRLLVGEAGDGSVLDLGSWGGLWSMPAATQGALVPLMLACAHAEGDEGLAFFRGGPAGG